MNSCGGQEDVLEVTIETYQNRLYRYRIEEERTHSIIHGELLRTCLQHAWMYSVIVTSTQVYVHAHT